MEKLKQRKKEEDEQNKKILSNLIGSEINYGSELQFLHNSSKMFITSKLFCSRNDKGSYQMDLTDDLGNGTIFKLQSKYKSHQEGERVYYGDHILIFNVKLSCYINFYWDYCENVSRDKKLLFLLKFFNYL